MFSLKPASFLGAWFLTSLLVAGSILIIAPRQVAAVNSDWHREIINGVTDTMTAFNIAHKGEVMGLAYKRASDAKIGFAIRTDPCTGDSCWTSKSTNIQTGAATYNLRGLASPLDAGVWLIALDDIAGATVVYRTTNDGTTWTAVVGPTTLGGSCGDLTADPTNSFAAFLYCDGATAPQLAYSTNGGSTWLTVAVGDNQGGPTGTSTAGSNGAGVSAILARGGQLYVNWPKSGGTGPRMIGTGVAESQAGGFWPVPFGTPCFNNLGTTLCYWLDHSITQFNQVGDAAGTPLYSYMDSGAWKSFTNSNNPLPGSTTASTISNQETVATCSAGLVNGNYQVAISGNAANNYVAAFTCTGTPAGLTVRLKAGVSGTWADTYTDPTIISKDVATDATTTKTYVAFTNGGFGDRPELIWASTPTAAAPAGASATVTVGATLTGFDVDPLNRVVVVRNAASPSAIRTYDPSTLTLLGSSPVANGCNKLDGVMAYSPSLSDSRPFAAFLDCTSSSTQANTLSIRNNLLGTPSQTNTVCTDFCDIDLQTASGFGIGNPESCNGAQSESLPGGSVEIGNLAGVPISWDNGQNPSGISPNDVKNTLVGFAFTDVGNGNVGVWVIAQRNQNPDKSCGLEVAFGPVAATKEIATWRAADGNDYLAAVGDTVSGKMWRVDITRATSQAQFVMPNVELPQVYPFQSPNDKAVGLGCALEYCTLLRPDGVVAKVHVLGTGLGTTITIASGAVTLGRAVAVSRDGNAVAYLNSATTVAIAALTDNPYGLTATPAGTIFTTFTIPTGTFKEMRLDDTARNLYVATSTTISRFDIAGTGTVGNQPLGTRDQGSNQKCIKADGSTGTCVVPTSTSTSTSTATGVAGFIGADPAVGAAAMGTSVEAYNAFLGLFWMVIIGLIFSAAAGAVGGAFGGGEGKVKRGLVFAGFGFLLGAVVGFVIAATIGLFSTRIVFLVVFLALITLGIPLAWMIRRRSVA